MCISEVFKGIVLKTSLLKSDVMASEGCNRKTIVRIVQVQIIHPKQGATGILAMFSGGRDGIFSPPVNHSNIRH